MKILIFGTGEFAHNHLPKATEIIQSLDYELIGFVDNNSEKKGTQFENKTVYAPYELYNLIYDMILIFCYDENRAEIYNQLIRQYHVPSEKIDSIYWLVHEKMKLTRAEKRVTIKSSGTPKVYDCFPFYNEIELLKIRLETLYDFVDKFVIVELNQTHRGVSKEYNYLKHQEEFSKYKDKIVYIQPDDIPKYQGAGDWTIENFQRRCVVRGLRDCQMQDIICVSDLDEIPNPEILKLCRENVSVNSRNPISIFLDENIFVLQQKFFYYFFNCKHDTDWYGSVIGRFGNLYDVQLRDWSVAKLLPHIPNGGWHFSYFGGLEKIKLKTCSTVDALPVSEEDILRRMENGLDIYGREGIKLKFIDKDDIGFPNVDKWIDRYPQFYHQ